MTKHDDYDFTQFKGSFDSPMAPDGDFSERMKRMLEKESGPADHQRKTTVLASPSRTNKDVPIPGRRTHPLTIVASVLVVLAVVVSSIWVLSGSPLEGEYGSAPSGIATLPADADDTPGADVTLSDELVIPFEFPSYSNPYTLDVIDGVTYTSHNKRGSGTNQGIPTDFVTAWEAKTGEKLWEIEDYSLWDIDLSVGVLVAFRSIPPTPDQLVTNIEVQSSTTLIGLDAETGEQLWEREIDDGTSAGSWQMQFVSIGDLIVTVDSEAGIYGLDRATGEQVWKSTFDRGTGTVTEFQSGPDAETIQITLYSFTMTAWNNQVALVNSDGLVQIIDPTNGKTVTSHRFGEEKSQVYSELDALPNGLLLTEVGEFNRLTAFEPISGNILWEREIDGHIQVDVAENGRIAVKSHVWKSGNFIMRLIGRGGHSTFQDLWIDGKTGEDVLTTERGQVDNPVFLVSNGEYLCTRTEEFICYDQAGTRYLISDGPWAQAFFDDDALYFDREDGLYRVDLP